MPCWSPGPAWPFLSAVGQVWPARRLAVGGHFHRDLETPLSLVPADNEPPCSYTSITFSVVESRCAVGTGFLLQGCRRPLGHHSSRHTPPIPRHQTPTISTPPLSVLDINFSATLNMDAYSMSVTSAARRKTSKIYQDLKVTQAHSGSPRTMSIMDRVLKVFGTQPRDSF